MRKIHVLAVALAGAVLALPALAAPNLAGTRWWADGCNIEFDFRADFSFQERDLWYPDQTGRTGHWRFDASRYDPEFDLGTLYLEFDGGETIRAPISDDLFVLNFSDGEGDSFDCGFMRVSD